MPREHVEFIQTQCLPWERGALGPGFEDVEVKVLSRDPRSGACSVLCRYPAGWSRGPHRLAAAHEFLVLDGRIEWDGTAYGLDDYAWLPAGWPMSGGRTASGAQTHPRGWREAQLRHECVEEMFLLGGDLIGERGVMYEGAYFWRPPGIWHGPFGSRRGSLSLIRMLEGRHRNERSGERRDFSLEPDYSPVLPRSIAGYGAKPWRPTSW